MGHFFSKLFKRSGGSGGDGSGGSSDDTHKVTASTASGGHTKKQPQHSTGPTLANSDSLSRNSQQSRTTNQQAITTTTPKTNVARPASPRQDQTTQLSSSVAPQRYPVNESNETSPTSRPHIVYRSAPVQSKPTESPSPVSDQQEVEDAVIKIQALVRGHLTRKALKDNSTTSNAPILGERQFDERCLYNPPSAVFLPSSPFNITSIQSQNRNHHNHHHHHNAQTQQSTTTCTPQDNNRLHEIKTVTGGNVNETTTNGLQSQGVNQSSVSTANNNNYVSYDVNNNNNQTDGNNNTENIGDSNNNSNINNNSDENTYNQSRQADKADLNESGTEPAPNDGASSIGEDSSLSAATTELNISTARLFLDQRQLSVDSAQQQVGTPTTASASLIINDYLSANNNERLAVPIATVLHPPAPQTTAPITTPTILETTSQQDERPKEEQTENRFSNSSNCLNVNLSARQGDDSDDDSIETRSLSSNQQRRSRHQQRNITNNSNSNNGDFDSPVTPAEVEGAAIKIQSAFRGYRTRKNSPYRSSSARCSPTNPSEDSEQQQRSMQNGYHHPNQTVGDLLSSPSPSPAEISPTDQQRYLPEPVSSEHAKNDDDINPVDNSLNLISQPAASNLACRRLARQRPTENHSSGSAEDQNQCLVSASPLIQSMSIDDENTCTVIEGKSQITNDESIEVDGKIEDNSSSRLDKSNIGTKQNEEVKSYSIDVVQQHKREFDSEKPRAKSLEQYNKHWPSQEQDTDSSALGAASSYNEDTEEEGGLIETTTTNLTNDDQQLSLTLETGQDTNFSEAEVTSQYDNQQALNEENDGELTVEMNHGNILPRPSINSTTADLSLANEDDESLMRQVQQMVDEMEANDGQDDDGDDNYDGAQLDDNSVHSNEDGNADENQQIVCEPESLSQASSSSSDLGEDIQLDEPVVDATQAEEELEGVRQITHKNSTEASDQARLAVITEEDSDDQQQQAILEVQHALEMESDDIEKRDPSGNMSNELRISSPIISMMSNPLSEKPSPKRIVDVEQNQAIDVPSLNIELVSNNLEKADLEIPEAPEEDHHQKNLTDQLGKDRDETEQIPSPNSGRSSPAEGSTTCGNSGTDEEDDENGDIANNGETSGQSRNAPKNNNGTASNQEKKASNKQNQQQQPTSNKNRNKKNKRKNKK